jgi:hypothetical protein
MCSPCLTAGWDTMNKNLREKIMQWFDGRNNKIDHLNWTQKKENPAKHLFTILGIAYISHKNAR